MEETELEWTKRLQRWIFENVIKSVTDNQAFWPKFVGPEAMKVFAEAFTHETASSQNYERHEVFGDVILKAVLMQVIMNKFPRLDQSGISDMVSYYSSDAVQTELMNGVGGGNLVRVGQLVKDMKYNVAGDVFEALFGALFLVSDFVNPGSGYPACFNLALKFYGNYQFDLSHSDGNPKTTVQQMFDRHTGFSAPDEVRSGPDGNPTITVSLNESNIRLLKTGGIDSFNIGQIIGQATSDSLQDATSKAYTQAFQVLNAAGATKQWTEQLKLRSDIASKEIAPLFPSFRDALVKNGYKSFEFRTSRKMTEKHRRVILLIAWDQTGAEHVLGAAAGGQRAIDTKKTLVQNYIESNKAKK